MKPKQDSATSVRRAPRRIWAAVCFNLLLLLLAFVAPHNMVSTASSNSSGAGMQSAVLFAVPMGLILVVGAAAAIWAYVWSRRMDCRMPWAAFLPLSIFAIGIAIAVGLTFTTPKGPVPEVQPTIPY